MKTFETKYKEAIQAEHQQLPTKTELKPPLTVNAFTIYSHINDKNVKNQLNQLVDPQINIQQNVCLLNNSDSLNELYDHINGTKC